MKQRIVIAFGLLFLLSCDGKKPQKPGFSPEKSGDGKVVAKPDDLGSEGGIQLQDSNSSSLRFADSIALTAIYARVFKKNEIGFEHCSAEIKNPKNLPPELSDCDNIFNRKERPEMGTFDIYASEFGRGPNNKTAATTLKLNYLRTLRAMLLRECTALIARERTNLANGQAAENFLVLREKPIAADIEKHMTALLGITGRSLDTGIAYETYAKALQEALKEATASEENINKAWVNGCVAISMDPLIFLY